MTDSISKAYNYLQNFKVAEKPIIDDSDLMPLESLIQEKNYYSPSIPRILFVGEFKAGKSTLLNALFGGDYAATDVLEMTSWVARYWPSDKKFCKIVFSNGSEEYVNPIEFKDKCQSRDYTVEELQNISRVDIGINNPNINYSVIDSPGFGSTTVENEKRVIDAISEADFIFWVLSCEVIGGMREAAIINSIKEKETPMICIVTKCDLIDDEDELQEVIEYVNETYEIDRDSIFPLSANNYINDQNEYETQRFKNLTQFIDRRITVNKEDIRRKAQESHLERIADHCRDLLESIETEVDKAIEARERYKSLLTTVRMTVASKMESDIVKYVSCNLFNPYRKSIIEKMDGIKGKLTSEKINEALENALPADYMDEFWENTLDYTLLRIKELWSEGIEENIEEIQKINNIVLSTKFTVAFSDDIDQFKTTTNVLADEAFRTSITASIGIAGVATAYAALLGPAAATITIGAAASGIGIPIALMGAGVSAAVYFVKSKGGASNSAKGEKILDITIEQFIDGIIRTEFMTKVKEFNLQTENNLISNFEKQVCSRLPESDLDKISNEIKNLKSELENIHYLVPTNGISQECPFCGKKVTGNTPYCLSCGNYLKRA
ncbi:Dynamin family protein [Dethiosulfatibacter aminovorans DSM 17477]|uniref:Dynamin family protein n=2 Tax=Dethiosulfatibacter TaxID=448125 RepID=A0A1M6IGD1_9FIRM|nr:Dynamin family protein [Dethiosulfatibacter aminovorans DSM 17477]